MELLSMVKVNLNEQHLVKIIPSQSRGQITFYRTYGVLWFRLLRGPHSLKVVQSVSKTGRSLYGTLAGLAHASRAEGPKTGPRPQVARTRMKNDTCYMFRPREGLLVTGAGFPGGLTDEKSSFPGTDGRWIGSEKVDGLRSSASYRTPPVQRVSYESELFC